MHLKNQNIWGFFSSSNVVACKYVTGFIIGIMKIKITSVKSYRKMGDMTKIAVFLFIYYFIKSYILKGYYENSYENLSIISYFLALTLIMTV